MDCPARGQIGKGNIGVHSRREKRYNCQEDGKTFAETVGTPSRLNVVLPLFGIHRENQHFDESLNRQIKIRCGMHADPG